MDKVKVWYKRSGKPWTYTCHISGGGRESQWIMYSHIMNSCGKWLDYNKLKRVGNTLTVSANSVAEPATVKHLIYPSHNKAKCARTLRVVKLRFAAARVGGVRKYRNRMDIRKTIYLTVSHALVGAVGFGIGIYTLPILTAPPAPSEIEIEQTSSQAKYRAEFKRDLAGSDAFHWGEGEVSLGDKYITLNGELAPGPDYKLYLSPEFVETETEFERLKDSMKLVGDVKTFKNFTVDVAPNIDISKFNTVVVWCETFKEFITSAKYQ
ncbi:Uncharacterised protein [BD1-7 clade bacterium]|nr:Uncharacterised protein [BD1-7 clade bacterium]